MKYRYTVQGMTCKGCKSFVEEKLKAIIGVTGVAVSLEDNEVELLADKHIDLDVIQNVLSPKYTLEEKREVKTNVISSKENLSKTKLQQLKPLFIIFLYIIVGSILINYKKWSFDEVMLDFMGLFFIVFSFFKMLDLENFPSSFKMYDPLAKQLSIYGWVYPFIETALGILLLMRIEVKLALIVTLVILAITTIGVVQSLLGKKTIRCACLGTVLNLPMTQATFIENTIMIIMAILLLFQIS